MLAFQVMRAGFPIIVCLCAFTATPAAAITGNAPAAPMQGRNAVMITGSGGTFCTGAAIARDLVLTAAHCVLPGASYKLIEFDSARAPQFLDVREIARHPNFDLQTLLGHRATADVALIKLAKPLPAEIAPATLGRGEKKPEPGDRYSVAVAGFSADSDLEPTKIFKFYYTDPDGNPDLSLATARLVIETCGGELLATVESDKVMLRLSVPPGEQ